MDDARGFEEDRDRDEFGGEPADGGGTAATAIGNDERRMHVRAYNHWVSLLDGRPYPSIASLDPASIADFGEHSVLLDFTAGPDDPAIAYLGRALREECGLTGPVARIADVPGRSLLSRLTDHYLQIIANRAPVGFEAEFVGNRGHTMMYRGILMPFASEGEQIDYIYGVINWKELVDAATQAGLEAEVEAALKAAPVPVAAAAWADGPGASAPAVDDIDRDDNHADQNFLPSHDLPELADRLAAARAAADAAVGADSRSRYALYEALGRAHDFALATREDVDAFAELLEDAGITVQARAPMTAVARLVFGEVDKARLTEFAAVLAYAARTEVAAGGLAALLAATDGGMKALVAAERTHRRGERPARPAPDPRTLDARPALARVRVPVDAAEGYVLLLGRIAGDAVEIVADVTAPAPLARAVGAAARRRAA